MPIDNVALRSFRNHLERFCHIFDASTIPIDNGMRRVCTNAGAIALNEATEPLARAAWDLMSGCDDAHGKLVLDHTLGGRISLQSSDSREGPWEPIPADAIKTKKLVVGGQGADALLVDAILKVYQVISLPTGAHAGQQRWAGGQAIAAYHVTTLESARKSLALTGSLPDATKSNGWVKRREGSAAIDAQRAIARQSETDAMRRRADAQLAEWKQEAERANPPTKQAELLRLSNELENVKANRRLPEYERLASELLARAICFGAFADRTTARLTFDKQFRLYPASGGAYFNFAYDLAGRPKGKWDEFTDGLPMIVAALKSDAATIASCPNPAAGDNEDDTLPAAIGRPERLVMAALSTFHAADLATVDAIHDAMDPADSVSKRSIFTALTKLIEAKLVERPEGERSGARLTLPGRRLIADLTT